MSYTTHVTGGFAITPPLTWREFQGSRFASDNWRDSDVVLRVDEETVDTPDGPLLRRTASALVMREISEYRADGLLGDVQAAVDAFPGHKFTGRLNCEGEEAGDLWRVVVRDGRATKVEPRIVWPDDETPEAQR
ncbi:DUF6205 family protein [Peterkaempfera griseoplana]|uniref:DUF6205 family protein n=1 Tax=Peterkaempfera griseoplana TaxID=66896 RepID=UPI0006E139D5|nr:DUF6205 family protein [Peterkaempfera griseoplana]